MKKCHVGIFTDAFYPQVNGVVTALMNIVNGLTDRGYQITLFVPQASRKKRDIPFRDDVDIVWLKSVRSAFYQDFRSTSPISVHIMNSVRRRKIDLIYFLTPYTSGYMGISTAKILRKPLIGTFHTFVSDPEYIKHLPIFKINRQWAHSRFWKYTGWRYTNLFYNSPDIVTAPSQRTADEMKANGCRKKIKVISNGVTLSQIRKNSEIRNEYGVKDTFNFLYVGRLAYEKNLEILLKAFASMAENHDRARLLLIGDGPQKKEYQKFTVKQGIENKVHFLGMIPHDKLIDEGYYSLGDVFITPSLTENQPMTILEALQFELPCIGMDARGIPDLILHQVNGLIAGGFSDSALADAMTQIYSDEETYNRLKKGALESLKKHEISFVLDEWEELIKQTIENRKSKRHRYNKRKRRMR